MINKYNIQEYIHESNLIEGIDNKKADQDSFVAWLDLMLSLKSNKISHYVIKETQRQITFHQDDLDNKYKGNYRDCGVMVGGRVCPDHRLVNAFMTDFIANMNYCLDPDAGRIPSIPSETKRMHIQFEFIHPFVDGNGRTGRMLMWAHEICIGEEPTLIKNSEKQEYYKWFD